MTDPLQTLPAVIWDFLHRSGGWWRAEAIAAALDRPLPLVEIALRDDRFASIATSAREIVYAPVLGVVG